MAILGGSGAVSMVAAFSVAFVAVVGVGALVTREDDGARVTGRMLPGQLLRPRAPEVHVGCFAVEPVPGVYHRPTADPTAPDPDPPSPPCHQPPAVTPL